MIDYLPNPSEVDNFAIDSSKTKKNDEGEEIPYKVRAKTASIVQRIGNF